MNLSEVLNVALPELPAKRVKSYPRLHPNLIMREQFVDGDLTFVSAISGGSYLCRFTPEQWALLQLFNGERSYAQVTQLYQDLGNSVEESQVQEFADSLEDLEFWYKTPLEANITASEKLAETRQKRAKKKSVDLTLIIVATRDSNSHIPWLHEAL